MVVLLSLHPRGQALLLLLTQWHRPSTATLDQLLPFSHRATERPREKSRIDGLNARRTRPLSCRKKGCGGAATCCRRPIPPSENRSPIFSIMFSFSSPWGQSVPRGVPYRRDTAEICRHIDIAPLCSCFLQNPTEGLPYKAIDRSLRLAQDKSWSFMPPHQYTHSLHANREREKSAFRFGGGRSKGAVRKSHERPFYFDY